MRIAPLAAQVQGKARQTHLVKNLAEREKICGRAAQAVDANHRAACLSLRQPTLAWKYHPVRSLPIELR